MSLGPWVTEGCSCTFCEKEARAPGFPPGEACSGRLGKSYFKTLLPTFDNFPWEKYFHFKTVFFFYFITSESDKLNKCQVHYIIFITLSFKLTKRKSNSLIPRSFPTSAECALSMNDLAVNFVNLRRLTGVPCLSDTILHAVVQTLKLA